MRRHFYTVALLLSSIWSFAQTRIYVNAAATGNNNGQGWPNAFTSLKTALTAAQPGDTVWVAQGTYKPTPGTERDSSFRLKSKVRLYGGFAGNETALSQRDWAAHPTLLSGDIGAVGDSTDNSFNILYLESPDSGTVVDGFVFRYGMAVPPSLSGSLFSPRQCGGALYVMAFNTFAYPVIRNCRFERNHAAIHGGAVCVNGGGDGTVAPQFLDCVFEGNSAGVNGGGIYRRGGSWVDRIPDFGNCTFRGNRAAERGGGLYFNDSERSDTLHVTGCRFVQNTAAMTGGGANFNLGRLAGSLLAIRNSRFEENSIHAYAITNSSLMYVRKVIVDSVFFYNNTASILNDVVYGDLVIDKCVFSKNNSFQVINTAGYDDALIKNCLFYQNNNQQCINSVSKISLLRNTFTEPFVYSCLSINTLYTIPIHNNFFYIENGILLYNVNVNIELTNNLIIGKRLVVGDGFPSLIAFKNNILVRKGVFSDFIERYNNPLKISFSNCLLDTSFYCDSLPAVTCGPGNLFGLDPLFVNPDSGDYRLQPCSPLIDAGNNDYVTDLPTDLAGAPRIQGGTVDIGAYEAPALALAAAPDAKAACEGFANGAIEAALLNACIPLAIWWQSGAQTGASLDSLAAGNYQVTVTDAKGHSLGFSVTVPSALPPTLQVDGSPVSCFGADDAMLAVKPLSGQPPFTYLWAPAGTTDSLAAGLGPGPVSVTVTDAAGCTATFAFNVMQPDSLQFTATVQDASNQQSADGSIMVNTVQGGTPPYHYLWQPGGSMETMIDNLLPGQYTLTVTDERGCEAAWTFEVKYLSGSSEADGTAVLLFWPNPAGESTLLTADFRKNALPVRIDLYDSAGRLAHPALLADSAAAIWQIPLSGLAAGQYIVLLRGAKNEILGAGKLIKQ